MDPASVRTRDGKDRFARRGRKGRFSPATAMSRRRAGSSGAGTPPTIGQADLELAKWIALAAMAVDHYGKIVDPDLYAVTHAIGRISFPVFATIIAPRLAARPQLAAAYVKRLLPWAAISQPVFILVGRDWYDGNILLTLLLGVVATMLVRTCAINRSPGTLAGLVALAPIAWFADYGIAGVAMIPLTAILASWRMSAASMASGPLGLIANISLSWPPVRFIDLPAILSSAVVGISMRAKVRLPRVPAHVFYGFYPAHLLLLHVADLMM